MTVDVTVDVLIEAPEWDAFGLEDLVQQAAEAALQRLGYGDAGFEISVMGCDDARIAELNGDFRAKPQPTNVLSWPSQERGSETPGGQPTPPDDPELGDIAIAWGVCRAEAEAAGKEISDHVSHLLVHGVLHLLGYDHINAQDAALMEALEVEILATLGIADPY
jgi:probable rRNA maturation factor